MILSIFCNPLTLLHFPGFSLEPFSSLAMVLYNTSFTKVDFPEPETPVTQLNTPNGNFTLTFFKLFSDASCISIAFVLLCFLLFFGTDICFLPLKYWPVIESSTCFTSSAVPLCHNLSTMCSCSWSNIDNLISRIHGVFIMFYN